MMEAVRTSETSVNFYETTRLKIPEGCYFHTRRRENLKSSLDSYKICFRNSQSLINFTPQSTFQVTAFF
jgi:hypothetical protein